MNFAEILSKQLISLFVKKKKKRKIKSFGKVVEKMFFLSKLLELLKDNGC